MKSVNLGGIGSRRMRNEGQADRFLAMSNHRDIILDPAITQVVLYRNAIPLTEIAVGSNLLSNKYIEYLIRSNRMIKVIRGINARQLYLSSQVLSMDIINIYCFIDRKNRKKIVALPVQMETTIFKTKYLYASCRSN